MSLMLLSCEKPQAEESNTGNVTFWTNEPVGWSLYVDDVNVGPVPQPYKINSTDDIPSCGDTRFLNMELIDGRHSYYMKISLPYPPYYLQSKIYFFDVTEGGCIVVRVTQ